MQSIHTPSADAVQHSLALIEHIKADIAQNDGVIPFSRYMDLALYAPGLGYYTAGSHKLGAGGDFITSPEVSSLFGQCIAHQFIEVMQELKDPILMELGAGTGKLACDLLLYLEKHAAALKNYYILELSPDLIERQKNTLETHCPHLLPKVKWLNALPSIPFEGIIFGNEVLDALPVSRFRVENHKLIELGVTWQHNRFAWQKLSAPISNFSPIEHIVKALPNGYESEFNANIPAFIKSLNDTLKKGMMLWIDYGYTEQEYYQIHRSSGSLRSYYRHQAFDEPFMFPGLTDITAHVNFTHLAHAGLDVDLILLGYTTQSAFLIGNGLEKRINDDEKLIHQAKMLASPIHMGESFKFMALGRDLSKPLSGFALDLRHKL